MRGQQRTTIRDVAREAGVGTTTVSRVINGGNLVAPAIRRRVEEVIRALNFQPSHAARSLKQHRTSSVGLIVPRLTDPFFANIASIAYTVCRARKHLLMISTSLDSEEQSLAEIKVFEQQRVDGLILVPPPVQSKEFQDYVRGLSARTVAVDLPVKGGGVSSVQTDNVQAMAKAAEHLIGHGRKRILLMTSDPELYTVKERRKGYVEAVEKAKLPALVSEHVYTLADAEAAIAAARAERGAIDAVLAVNGQVGALAFHALDRLHVSVPNEVAFITFDDFAMADMLRPAVTCVAQPLETIGRAATELLFSMMETPGQKARTVRLPSELVIRKSCGCA